jgi:NAD(P)-dependent dehydrogenase (short-subunit alcohol dehydrogenase family)
MRGLTGKAAIVTGASSGIGEACARRLAAEGVKTTLVARRAAKLDKIAEEIRAAGGEAIGVMADVANEPDIVRMVRACIEAYGRLDILVNNAAMQALSAIEEMNREEWDRTIAVNFTGTALGIKHAVPFMKRQRGGSIVNMSSIHDIATAPNMGAYPATKSAQSALTRQLALELGPFGIRVNAIQPGYIPTELSLPDWTRQGGGDPHVFMAKLAESIALRRVGQPEEIASVAAFLASEESSYVNGATILVDGGVAMSL